MDSLKPAQFSKSVTKEFSKMMTKFCKENLTFNQIVQVTGNLTFNIDGNEVIHTSVAEVVSASASVVGSPSRTSDETVVSADDNEASGNEELGLEGDNTSVSDSCSILHNQEQSKVAIKKDPDEKITKLVVKLDKSKKHRKNRQQTAVTCSICELSLPSKVLLKRHAQQYHSVKGKAQLFPCSHCPLIFFYNDEYLQHGESCLSQKLAKESGFDEVKEEAHPKDCSCLSCRQPSRPPLKKSTKGKKKRKTKGRGIFPCDLCDKVFTAQSTLYHHKRGIHSGIKPYKCSLCDQSFNFHHSMKLHILKHRGLRPYQCKTCSKSYLTASHLKGHVDAVHLPHKRFVCVICNKSFPYDNSLKMHMKLHSGEKPYMCCICSKAFISRSALKVHESSHVEGKEFECSVCNKMYKTEVLLKAHSRRHTSDGSRYMCDVCGNRFMFKSNLEAHYKVHGDTRSFKCEECGKSFKTYATLYSHQLVHRKDNMFPCNSCDKSFKTKERLKAHEKRHLGLKPFSCQLCGSCFPDKGGLSKHKKTVHSSQTRYACPVCNKGSNRADNLRVHMKVHGDASLLNISLVDLEVQPANENTEHNTAGQEVSIGQEKVEAQNNFYYKASETKTWTGESARNSQYFKVDRNMAVADGIPSNNSHPSMQPNSNSVSTTVAKTSNGLVTNNTVHIPNSLYFMQNQGYSIVNDGRTVCPVPVDSNTFVHEGQMLTFPVSQEGFN